VLERHTAGNSVVTYRSPLLRSARIPHAFSTRIGGVSTGAFASLNLGNPNGCPQQDSLDHIAENYRRLAESIDCLERRRVFAHQIHGATVLTPDACGLSSAAPTPCELGKADALTTADPALLLSIRTADCVPVLLADRSGRRVAAVHAGWRGVIAGVVLETLKHFDRPQEVIAAIGPCIGYDAFEVGPDVLDEFERTFGISAPTRRLPDGKGRVDLKEAIRLQLVNAGVPPERIDLTDRCTFTHASEFFSHRREHGVTGRMAAVIGVAS